MPLDRTPVTKAGDGDPNQQPPVRDNPGGDETNAPQGQSGHGDEDSTVPMSPETQQERERVAAQDRLAAEHRARQEQSDQPADQQGGQQDDQPTDQPSSAELWQSFRDAGNGLTPRQRLQRQAALQQQQRAAQEQAEQEEQQRHQTQQDALLREYEAATAELESMKGRISDVMDVITQSVQGVQDGQVRITHAYAQDIKNVIRKGDNHFIKWDEMIGTVFNLGLRIDHIDKAKLDSWSDGERSRYFDALGKFESKCGEFEDLCRNFEDIFRQNQPTTTTGHALPNPNPHRVKLKPGPSFNISDSETNSNGSPSPSRGDRGFSQEEIEEHRQAELAAQRKVSSQNLNNSYVAPTTSSRANFVPLRTNLPPTSAAATLTTSAPSNKPIIDERMLRAALNNAQLAATLEAINRPAVSVHASQIGPVVSQPTGRPHPSESTNPPWVDARGNPINWAAQYPNHFGAHHQPTPIYQPNPFIPMYTPQPADLPQDRHHHPAHDEMAELREQMERMKRDLTAKFLSSTPAHPGMPSPSGLQEDWIDRLAKAIALVHKERSKLPFIKLKTFSGAPGTFFEFWDSFHNHVEARNLEPFEKLHYLKEYLLPPASSCISGYSITNENYELARRKLHKKYGDMELLLSSAIREVVFKPQATRESQNAEMINFLRTIVQRLQTYDLSFEDKCQNLILMAVFTTKITPNLSERWECHKKRERKAARLHTITLSKVSSDADESTLNPSQRTFDSIKSHWRIMEFLEFCEEEIDAIEKSRQHYSDGTAPTKPPSASTAPPTAKESGGSSSSNNHPKSSNSDHKKGSSSSKSHPPSAGFVATETTKEKPAKRATGDYPVYETGCLFCGTADHEPVTCPKMHDMPINERWDRVRLYTRNITPCCWKCLATNHIAPHCDKPDCNVNNCGMRHHPILHQDKKGVPNGNNDLEKDKSSITPNVSNN